MSPKHDLIVVGTSFASSFFLHRYLDHGPKDVSILVLEKGRPDSLRWQLDNLRWSSFEGTTIANRTPEKPWDFAIGFGGTSNAWWACTPRMMPNDFQLRAKYGDVRDAESFTYSDTLVPSITFKPKKDSGSLVVQKIEVMPSPKTDG